MKWAFIFFLIPFFFISSTFANCPKLETVTYGCVSIDHQKHCNWAAEWYEGFPDDTAEPGDQASAFRRVFWSTADGEPPMPGHFGTTICFYENSHGKKIELVQNFWGGVAYPQKGNWVDGKWEGYDGRQCTDSTSACDFDYPPALKS